MTASRAPLLVMPGLDPGIHPGHILRRVAAAFCARDPLDVRDVDGRVKPGHDDERVARATRTSGTGL